MELRELITGAPWREAVTYRETWPHEYVLLQKDGQRELLEAVCERLRNGEGVSCRFFAMRNQYLFVGDYKYWLMVSPDQVDWDHEEVLNRARLYRDRRDFVIQDGDSGMKDDYPSMPATDAEGESGAMATTGEDSRDLIDALHRFSENDRDLAELGHLLVESRSEFDALTFLGLSASEAVHSKILAWLLDPRGSHGAGDRFLRGFLRDSAAVATAAGVYVGDLDDESAFEWSATRVQQEWYNVVDGHEGRLDILLINEAEGFVCAIENKVFSGEHSEQLTRYRRALADAYPDLHSRHVFLSPEGILPLREEERQYWVPVSYATVLQLVEQTITQGDEPIRDDVSSFLLQYSTTLRRRVVPDTTSNARALARKIYMENRGTIDFINANRPNYKEEGKAIVKAAIALHDRWVLDREERELVFFRSTDWDPFEVLKTGTGWGNPGSLITFGFDVRPDHLHLICTLGPGTDEAVRRKIHEDISRQRGLFSHAGKELRSSYTRLDVKGPITEDADYGNWDDPAVRAKILDWVADFAENKFPQMNSVIVESLRECEALGMSQSPR